MMKMTTLKDVKNSLEKMQYVVKVEPSVRLRARAAVDAMLEYTGAATKKT
jgi:quinolinate synthase